MANVIGNSISSPTTVLDTASTLVNRPGDLAVLEINGTTFVYSISRSDDAVQIWEFGADGSLTPVSTILDTPGTTLDTPTTIAAVEVGGQPLLIVGNFPDRGLTVYTLTDAVPHATFAFTVSDSDDSDFEFGYPIQIQIAETLFGGTFLYVPGVLDDGLTVFEIESTGALTHVQDINGASVPGASLNSPNISDAIALTPSSLIGAINYFVTSGTNSPNVTLFEQGQDGKLTEVTSFTPSVPITLGGKPAGVGIGNELFIYTQDRFTDTLIATKHSLTSGVTEELFVMTGVQELNEIYEINAVEVGGRTFLVAFTLGENNAVWFEVDTNPLSTSKGEITLITETVFPGAPGTYAGSDAEVVEIGGRSFVLTGNIFRNQIDIYEIGAGDDVLEGTSRADVIEGRGGDDIIFGFEGADLISPGDGDDVVYAGDGDDFVEVSAGVDNLFGGSGSDALDAQSFNAAGGVTVDLLRNEIFLPDGTEQFVSGFERAFGTQNADIFVGTEADNEFYGLDGDDLMRGRGGDDDMYGDAGNDQLFGADGDDFIFASDGADLVNGGTGNDTISGGGGADRLFAGSGDDAVTGGDGTDLMRGNDGNDTLSGGNGADMVFGQTGDDIMSGGLGNDTLSGGSGRDEINAGAGRDEITGGSAADVFVFDTVATGGGGLNTITDFKDGTDRLDVSAYGLNAGQVLALAAQNGAATDISFADGQVIRLSNFAVGDLDASDLIL